MTAEIKTILFDFRLKSVPSGDQVSAQLIDILESEAFSKSDKFSKLLAVPLQQRNPSIKTSIYETDNSEAFVTVRVYDKESYGLLTLQIELTSSLYDDLLDKYDPVPEEALRSSFQKSLDSNADSATFLSAIKRCLKDTPYLRTSDNRIVEYNYKEVLFSDRSPYQQIQIVDTIDFGRFLLLDEMANLAEGDTVQYTHSLMNLPHENYKGKEVLILGGGDGGLIKELFELGDDCPAFVTMVDIDEMVMSACNQFMPNVCGTFLDKKNWEGPRHKIIAGDAIQYLKDCQASEKKFDYIFGDLTDTPVSTGPRDSDLWQFLKLIMEMAVLLIKPNTGKYMTHCTGINVQSALQDYEKVLGELAGGKCRFNQTTNFVNSFMETWVFYQITRVEE